MKKDKPKSLFDDEWSRFPNGGASWAALNPPREPEPVVYLKEDEWPRPKERTDQVFAKSCAPENWSCTKPGTATVPASDFGKIMLVAPMLVPSSIEALKLAVGFDAVLGRIAGSGLLQNGFRWALRGNPTGVFIAGMLPTQMGDGTLYKDDDLRQLSRAPTRVRFQFRRDAEGVMQVYGIHTGPSGDDSVLADAERGDGAPRPLWRRPVASDSQVGLIPKRNHQHHSQGLGLEALVGLGGVAVRPGHVLAFDAQGGGHLEPFASHFLAVQKQDHRPNSSRTKLKRSSLPSNSSPAHSTHS